MREIALFLLLLPVYVVFLLASGLAIAALFVLAVPYVLGKLIWATATGKGLGPGW